MDIFCRSTGIENGGQYSATNWFQVTWCPLVDLRRTDLCLATCCCSEARVLWMNLCWQGNQCLLWRYVSINLSWIQSLWILLFQRQIYMYIVNNRGNKFTGTSNCRVTSRAVSFLWEIRNHVPFQTKFCSCNVFCKCTCNCKRYAVDIVGGTGEFRQSSCSRYRNWWKTTCVVWRDQSCSTHTTQ